MVIRVDVAGSLSAALSTLFKLPPVWFSPNLSAEGMTANNSLIIIFAIHLLFLETWFFYAYIPRLV